MSDVAAHHQVEVRERWIASQVVAGEDAQSRTDFAIR
jgi:hypothetical protein